MFYQGSFLEKVGNTKMGITANDFELIKNHIMPKMDNTQIDELVNVLENMKKSTVLGNLKERFKEINERLKSNNKTFKIAFEIKGTIESLLTLNDDYLNALQDGYHTDVEEIYGSDIYVNVDNVSFIDHDNLQFNRDKLSGIITDKVSDALNDYVYADDLASDSVVGKVVSELNNMDKEIQANKLTWESVYEDVKKENEKLASE